MMALARVLLDTDILSAIMRKNPVVVSKSRSYLAEHKKLTLSVITRYEILRGLKPKVLLSGLRSLIYSVSETQFYLSLTML